MSANYCRNCGQELSVDAKFCPECGTEVDNDAGKSELGQGDTNQKLAVDQESIPEQETPAEEQTHKSSIDGVSLLSNEVVYENRHPTWYLPSWVGYMVLAFIILLVGLIAATAESIFGGIVIAGLIFGYVYYARKSSRYVVTNKRVIKKMGLFSKKTQEVTVQDIRNLQTSQSWGESWHDYGDIEISTTTSGGNVKLQAVPDVNQVAGVIRERQQAAK